jgi:CheY-like chemotaxis protein/HPt (histidine-containing phosphotransfer) domain-containing protein
MLSHPPRRWELHVALERLLEGANPLELVEHIAHTSIPFRFVDRPRVLVVEDNNINQEVLHEMLTALGCDADMVENGAEALTALSRRQYPVVLMDCQMPVLDGYETARRIRKLEVPVNRTPMIAVTAHAAQGEVEKVLAAGMNNYLSKPVDPRALAEALADWLPIDRDWERPSALGSTAPESSKKQAGSEALVDSVRRSKTVIRLFLKLVPGQIEDVANAVRDDDAKALEEHAHRLKGSCRSIGARAMGELCATLEQGLEGASDTLSKLGHEPERVTAALQGELAALEQAAG